MKAVPVWTTVYFQSYGKVHLRKEFTISGRDHHWADDSTVTTEATCTPTATGDHTSQAEAGQNPTSNCNELLNDQVDEPISVKRRLLFEDVDEQSQEQERWLCSGDRKPKEARGGLTRRDV